MGRKVNLTGKIFGELKILGEAPKHITSGGNSLTVWKCECTCGKIKEVMTVALRSGSTLSCGHIRTEIVTQTGIRNRKQDPKKTSLKGIYNRTKRASEKRGLPWELSLKEFEDIVFLNCYWCGIPPENDYNYCLSKNGYTQRKNINLGIAKEAWIKVNGIDRIDNSAGYKIENCLPCCKWCNFARNARTVEEFSLWIKRISEYANSVYK